MPDVTSYPKRPEYLLFISSDGVDANICDYLQTLSSSINNRASQSVEEVIVVISESLAARLAQTAARNEAKLPEALGTPSNDDLMED